MNTAHRGVSQSSTLFGMNTTDRSIAIIGDGQMGLVMADAFVERGLQTRIFSPFVESARALTALRKSPRLPGFVLDDRVMVTADPEEATANVDLMVNAIPTQFVRDVWSRLAPHDAGCGTHPPIVSVTKGLEESTMLRPSEVIRSTLTAKADRAIAVLSGPTIAAELARRLPATMVVASDGEALARLVQDSCDVPWLRVYRHDDIIGVELAGAVKNVIAIAAGAVDGLRIGDNAKSALLARGLAEIARLGIALGARVDTFFGVAGVGDLATTCFSPEGRNRTCGERLGRGETLDDILATTASIVEGVATAKALRELSTAHGVDMPISDAVYATLFEGRSPGDSIRDLMSRALKAERIG